MSKDFKEWEKPPKAEPQKVITTCVTVPMALLEANEREQTMQSKEYKLPNGKKAVFEYDACGIGKITLECMDELMSMIADRPQGEWIRDRYWSRGVGMGEDYGFFYKCSMCEYEVESGYTRCGFNYCPYCGSQMKGAVDE